MGYEEFLKMSMEQMADIVKKEGKFLIEKKYSEKCVKLYALGNFFVEIWFNLPQNIRDFNFLLGIKSFKKPRGLDRYINNSERFNLVNYY